MKWISKIRNDLKEEKVGVIFFKSLNCLGKAAGRRDYVWKNMKVEQHAAKSWNERQLGERGMQRLKCWKPQRLELKKVTWMQKAEELVLFVSEKKNFIDKVSVELFLESTLDHNDCHI